MSYDCTTPYCSNNPASSGTYEAYRGELCSRCEDEWIAEHCTRCKAYWPYETKLCDSCVDEVEGAPV